MVGSKRRLRKMSRKTFELYVGLYIVLEVFHLEKDLLMGQFCESQQDNSQIDHRVREACGMLVFRSLQILWNRENPS